MSSVSQIRKEGLDKFYTDSQYAKKCIEVVNSKYAINDWTIIIEPSAGNGSFIKQIKFKNKIGIDIDPEDKTIEKRDFFDFEYKRVKGDKILVIGNPPFGKVSSLAIKFFNHASKFCDVIAFIIPRTFRRVSVQNKLNPFFHIVYDEETPTKPCQFTPKMNVKCCFQIWEKKENKRETINLPLKHKDWEFLGFGPKDEKGQPTPPKNADFAIRAYGGKIGFIQINNLQELRPKSWHWIKANIDKDILMKRFSNLDYSNSLNTARQNSMGRKELVSLYQAFIDTEL